MKRIGIPFLLSPPSIRHRQSTDFIGTLLIPLVGGCLLCTLFSPQGIVPRSAASGTGCLSVFQLPEFRCYLGSVPPPPPGFSLSSWPVPFTFLCYRFSGIPGAVEIMWVATGHLLEKTRQGPRQSSRKRGRRPGHTEAILFSGYSH